MILTAVSMSLEQAEAEGYLCELGPDGWTVLPELAEDADHVLLWRVDHATRGAWSRLFVNQALAAEAAVSLADWDGAGWVS